MEDIKQDKKQDKKKVDIFSLFKKEKAIKFETNSEIVSILMCKMNQGDRKSILEQYYKDLEDTKSEYIVREKSSNYIRDSIKRITKKDLIENLVEHDKPERLRLLGLLPEYDKLSDEEKDKKAKDEIDKWEKVKTEELNAKDVEEVKNIFVDNAIDYKALIKSASNLNYNSLVKMCFNVDTKEPIFKSIDDIFKLNDKAIIDWLLKELEIFKEFESSEAIREVTTSIDFLEGGQSQNH